MIMIIQSQLT